MPTSSYRTCNAGIQSIAHLVILAGAKHIYGSMYSIYRLFSHESKHIVLVSIQKAIKSHQLVL